jgi:inner membrane protein
MGYIIYRATETAVAAQRWQLMVFYLLVANAADLDFIPGLLVGMPNRYHHGVSHSVGFAALIAVACSLLMFFLKRDSFSRSFPIVFCLYCSHIVLDYLSIDTTSPYGVPLFWPFSNEYYIASFAFLPSIRRASISGVEFVTSLFSLHNLLAISVEFLLLFPFILLISAFRKQASFSAK